MALLRDQEPGSGTCSKTRLILISFRIAELFKILKWLVMVGEDCEVSILLGCILPFGLHSFELSKL